VGCKNLSNLISQYWLLESGWCFFFLAPPQTDGDEFGNITLFLPRGKSLKSVRRTITAQVVLNSNSMTGEEASIERLFVIFFLAVKRLYSPILLTAAKRKKDKKQEICFT